MNEQAKPMQKPIQNMREKILLEPEVVLEDHDLMRALVDANERNLGANIVDLRGIAMERLEGRLVRLEETHRSVIAAAYENLASTNLIHNACLKLLDPPGFGAFLQFLAGDLCDVLRVSALRLVLETHEQTAGNLGFDDLLYFVEPGAIDQYITAGRNLKVRPVTMRQVSPASRDVYGDATSFIKSEALLKLDIGEGRLPGLLVMGSDNPHQFRSNQGTDLLDFFGGVFEKQMRHWLA